MKRVRSWIVLAGASLAVLSALVTPPRVSAQARVSISDLTIDDRPPPDAYREVLAAAMRPSVDAIRECYANRLTAVPGLAGDYRLRLWVSNHEVIRATPESSVGDETLERCTRDAIYRFRMPAEAPTGGAWVRLTVRFVGPTAGAAVAGAAGAASTGAASTGTASTGAAGTTGTASTGAAGTTGTGSTGVASASGGAPSGSGTLAGAFGAAGATMGSLMRLLPESDALPSVRIDALRGPLASMDVGSTLPVPMLASCARDGVSGELPVGRRGLRDADTRACVVRAIEALAFPPGSGPSRARVTVRFPASPAAR